MLLANNPGKMTLEGTNTWVLRGPGSDEVVIVDPGPDDDEHIAAVAGVGHIALVLISHRHGDHTDAIDKLVDLTGAPVRSAGSGFLRGLSGELIDGEVIDAAGVRITVWATPGHTADSLSFVLDDAVLTADTVLGRGTTVIDNEDGSLADYLDSLQRLRGLGGRTVLPGHGPDLADIEAVAQGYLAHREQRLDQIRSALRTLGDDATTRQVVEHVYVDVDEEVVGRRRMVGAGPAGLSASLRLTRESDHMVVPPAIEQPSRLSRVASGRAWPAVRSPKSARSYPPGESSRDGEIGQRLVHRLAGCPDQLGDLFLSQVVRHPHRAALLGTEALRELQQLLGDPTGHVGEDEVGEVVVGAAQPAGQHAQQLLGDFGAIGDPGPQRVAVHRHRPHLGDRRRARGPRPGVEYRELTEHVGRAHYGQQIFPAVR